MPGPPAALSILNVGYKSTNYWLLSRGRSRLLVDLGWPGTLATLETILRRADVPVAEIAYGLATHYHPDHAGLADDLKKHGMQLIVMENQRVLPEGKDGKHFIRVGESRNTYLTFADSRAFLRGLGIDGEIVPTPGHSADSVSLVLDDGSAFTGDLQPADFGPDETSRAELAASWDRLRALGVKTIYPAHGPTRNLRS